MPFYQMTGTRPEYTSSEQDTGYLERAGETDLKNDMTDRADVQKKC